MKTVRNIKSIQELKMSVENSIKQIKQSNYKNYFDFAYGITLILVIQINHQQ
jgi:hypothetical protein